MDAQIVKLAKSSGLDPAAILAFISVETGGRGFDQSTGRIIIQFEPAWFKKKEPFAPSGKWSVNKVDVQSREWEAFNEAYSINPNSAMESTSIGLGQIMGFHWRRLGYDAVGDMWSDAKKGLDRQLSQLVKFIRTDARLSTALAAKDWPTVASIYNGAKYKELAAKIGREPYDISMEKAYRSWLYNTTNAQTV